MTYEAVWASGVRVRFRPLTWKEFKRVNRADLPLPVRNLMVYKICVLEGPPPEQVPAGIVAWIGCGMVDENPFTGQYNLLNQYIDLGRKWLQSSYLEHAKALVAGTFHYRFEEIEEWDAEQFFKRLAQAEFLVGNKVEPADPAKTASEHHEDSFARQSRLRKEALTQRRADLRKQVDNRRQAWGR